MKLYGKNPVLERLKSQPKTIKKILILEGHPESDYIRQKAKKWNIPFFAIPRDRMHKLGDHLNAQGLIVDVEDFAYLPFGELLDQALEKKQTVIFLDELTDPQNFGGIIRSLACLGDFCVVLPKHGSVGVTESVLRVACGGDNYVPVAKVSNLSNALSNAKEKGFWIAGAVVNGGEDIMSAQLSFPLALVIGSEQKGIRDITKKHLDISLSIQMAEPRLSMNAAHATSIFAYEISRQKKQEKK